MVARSADGRELQEARVEIGPDRSVSTRLPEGAASVSVEVSRTEAVVSVLVTSPRGAVVVPLAETVRRGLVPQVDPALP